MLLNRYIKTLAIIFIIMMSVPLGLSIAAASGNSPALPPITAPVDGAYYNSTTSVRLEWQVPTDPEGDTLELKVVFSGPSNTQPPPISYNSALAASSDVALLKPMFSLPTPVSSNPAGAAMFFQPQNGFNVNLTEGRWWWDVYAWDGTTYSTVTPAVAPRTPRSFILDFTKPVVNNLLVSNAIFHPASPDTTKRTTTLSYTLSETSSVVIEVLNASGVVVRTLDSGLVPIGVPPVNQSIVWDGAGATGDGIYTFRVVATDLAGNISNPATKTVELKSSIPGITFDTPALTNNPFSPLPASPGVKDFTRLNYIVNDTSSVRIVIYPAATPATITKVLMNTTQQIPGNYNKTWDGTDDAAGASVADGDYTFAITATNEVGFATTITRNVTVDKTVTNINPFAITPTPFSPNIGSTNITFSLSEDATVEILIKDQARVVTKRRLQIPTYMTQRPALNPYTVLWDGRDDSGNIVGNATYSYEIITEDLAGNSNTNVGQVVVEKDAPIIAPYSVSPAAISPLPISPGVADEATIAYTTSKDGTVEIRVIAVGGPQVRKFGPYYRTAGNHTETWDGTDGSGNTSEGNYRIEIYLTSVSGVAGSPNPAVLQVAVDITPPNITALKVVPTFFSPGNSAGVMDTTTLYYTLSETADVTIKVMDPSNSPVKTLLNSIKQSDGAKNIVWNGMDDSNTVLPDGVYTFQITAVDAALNSTTVTKTVEIDNANPVVTILSSQPNPFAPDSQDNNMKKNTTRYIINDARASCTTEVVVKTKIGALVKSLMSNTLITTGTVQTIQWDGKNALSQTVEDGTYAVYINAIDLAGNASTEASVEVNIQNRGPSITAVRYRDNRDTIDTNDSIEIVFDTPIDDNAFIVGGVKVDVSTIFQVVGTGTFGVNAFIDTGKYANDNIIEIRLGAGYVKFRENADTLLILNSTDRVRSYPTLVTTKDKDTPHLVLDGSPPYLVSSKYIDVGNDGLNRGDNIVLKFNEPVSVAQNSPSAIRLLPIGRGYTIGGGAAISTGSANQIIVTLGDVTTTSVVIKGLFDITGVNPIPTGVNVVEGQTAIVDNAGNPATANLNIPTPPVPGVDVGSDDTTGPKVVYAKYVDANKTPGNGGLSAGDYILVGFDKAILVSPDPNPFPGNIFKLPVANDTFGTGATFTYTGVKEVGVILGANPKIRVSGVYSLGNDIEGRPSGLDINTVTLANPEISDLAGNAAYQSIPVDIVPSTSNVPKILVSKITSQVGGEIVDNLINPTTGTFTLIAIVDDNTLTTGDVKADLSSIFSGSTEVILDRDGITTTFKKTIVFPTVPYLNGSKTFKITATDFSGNTSLPYTFTAYVIEPATEVIGEINPSSIPKRADASAPAEDFTATIMPKIQSYNKGVDTIMIKHPGSGYSFTNDTIDVFVGGVKITTDDYQYTKNTVSPLLTITLSSKCKLVSTTANPRVSVNFKLNVPLTANSPAGSTFEVYVNEASFLAPYQQAVNPGDADGIAENNNKFKVVVSDIGIESVKTKLDYSEFFWRINFEVKFNKELVTSKMPVCSYQPENVTPAIAEIPIQSLRFENKPDTTVTGNPSKAVLTGYARVPIDNASYINNFTLFARNFMDQDGILIAKVYKKNNTMTAGFVITAFGNPIDDRDLILTIKSTTAVTQAFQLGIRQPGKTPVYRQKNELVSLRQDLFAYKYRIDENFSSQIDMAIFNPGETFAAQAPRLNAKKSGAPANSTDENPGIYSVNVARCDASKALAAKTRDGMFEISRASQRADNAKTFIIAPQPVKDDGEAYRAEGLIRVGGIYGVFPEAQTDENHPYLVKLKVNPDYAEYLKYRAEDTKNINDGQVGVYTLSDGKWKYVGGAGEGGGVYSAETQKSGTFGLFADVDKPVMAIENCGGAIAIKNEIKITVADSGSGVNENSLKLVNADGTKCGIQASEVKSTEKGVEFRLKPENFKHTGVAAGVNSGIAFEISDNTGNIVKSQPLTYQIVVSNDIYSSIAVYPNPARTFACVRYKLDRNAEEVVLKIYDASMNTVYETDMNPTIASNTAHQIRWNLVNNDGETVSNGVYYYRLKIKVGGETIEKKGKIAVLK